VTCTGPGPDGEPCPHEASEGQLCSGHARFRRRHPDQPLVPLRPRGRGPKQVLLDAIEAWYGAADQDDELHDRAWHRLRVAMRRYVLAPKPTDPRGHGQK
jgi:hypothetical protein